MTFTAAALIEMAAAKTTPTTRSKKSSSLMARRYTRRLINAPRHSTRPSRKLLPLVYLSICGVLAFRVLNAPSIASVLEVREKNLMSNRELRPASDYSPRHRNGQQDPGATKTSVTKGKPDATSTKLLSSPSPTGLRSTRVDEVATARNIHGTRQSRSFTAPRTASMNTPTQQARIPTSNDIGKGMEQPIDQFIHVIKTRYMQHQPNLLDLGLARLKLLQAFTLPSIESQHSHNFMWIIQTDPTLIPELKGAMVETLSNSTLSDRIILLGENKNGKCFRHSPPHAPDLVLFGNSKLYSSYLAKAKSGSYIVVETRLDADDGLPNDFVDTIQGEVRKRIHRDKDWIQWCTTHHQEWQTTHPNLAERAGTKKPFNLRRFFQSLGQGKKSKISDAFQMASPYGYIKTLNSTSCITAGLTVAYGKNASRDDLPGTMPHMAIHEMIPYCSTQEQGNVRTHCLQTMYSQKPGALRARSPTSTGMSKVAIPLHELEEEYKKQSKKYMGYVAPTRDKDPLSLLWDGVEQSYGMSRHQIRKLRTYLVDHTPTIAADNLKGQCTVGHSCKQATRNLLKKLAEITTPEQDDKENKERPGQSPKKSESSTTSNPGSRGGIIADSASKSQQQGRPPLQRRKHKKKATNFTAKKE